MGGQAAKLTCYECCCSHPYHAGPAVSQGELARIERSPLVRTELSPLVRIELSPRRPMKQVSGVREADWRSAKCSP